jgi:uncharacterized protein YcaQ
MKHTTLEQLRRYAVSRSLFSPTTLPRALERLGFVQADPIRAPARAQDLMLRHRVKDYRAGDLERRYPRLAIEEDFFINYGFVPRATHELMHPRTPRTVWPQAKWAQAHAVLEFVRTHGTVHPRAVDAHFDHGKTHNWFGGSSNASTQLLDGMHYRGLLRVAGREGGVRTYAARPAWGGLPASVSATEPSPNGAPAQGPGRSDAVEPDTAMDLLVDVIVGLYAPLPERSLSELVSHLRAATPQWTQHRPAALARAKTRLPSAEIAGTRWFWPAGESPASRRHVVPEEVRLLAPFDPVVWDRRRFEMFWGWAYRFEAYTPAPKRLRGYYALPLLWRDQVIGWGNVAVQDGRLLVDLGYQRGKAPRERAFSRAMDEELERMRAFLGAGLALGRQQQRRL